MIQILADLKVNPPSAGRGSKEVSIMKPGLGGHLGKQPPGRLPAWQVKK